MKEQYYLDHNNLKTRSRPHSPDSNRDERAWSSKREGIINVDEV